MVRIWKACRNGILEKVGMFAWEVCRLHVQTIRMSLVHPCTSGVSKTRCLFPLWRSNDKPSCSSYKKNETNPRKQGRLDSSTWVQSWELVPLIWKPHFSQFGGFLRLNTADIHLNLFSWSMADTHSLHTKKDRIAATKKTKWQREYIKQRRGLPFAQWKGT